MSAKFWVAKYVQEPIRFEPKNIGVIVQKNNVFTSRFLGQKDNLTLDQRKLKGFKFPTVYVQWYSYWQSCLNKHDIDSILKSATANYFVVAGGEVTDTGSDDTSKICDFVYETIVGDGLMSAFAFDEEPAQLIELSRKISKLLDEHDLLKSSAVRYPVVRKQKIQGKVVAHTPSFSQRNGSLYVIEHINFGSSPTKVRDRAGYMAYMFADICEHETNALTYSIVDPDPDSAGEQIEYAQSILNGTSKVINWANESERNMFLDERIQVAQMIRPSELTLFS